VVVARTLFDELDDEWSRLGTSRSGKRAMERWALDDSAPLTTLEALRHEIGRGFQSDISNHLLRQVVEKARHDELAARLALQCMMPAMRTAARRWQSLDTRMDIQSTVITETLSKIRQFPLERRKGNVAANISRDVNQKFSRRASKGRVEEVYAEYDRPAPIPTDSKSELLALVAEGSRRGAIDQVGAELIVRTRVFDERPETLSSLYGIKTPSLRRRRQRAEERLEAFVNG
jgi:hypothetical protein